ncbi:HEAT repeat domain-containing protein [Actinoplanes solisilvae]|uniref:HEAT repeat domain-containing protein n=1 Tax=Actinoplanes solisilvae TaxID=2486853 RepID=UPI001F0BA719|nr:HEAT repeat domain-containing protein [Actinoplanes solisilvae]
MRDWMRERERLLKRAEGNFERSLELMRSRDPQLKEDGFSLLGPLACAHVEDLMAEYRHPDTIDRYWLLELIADSASDQAFELLVEALDHEREDFRWRAARALQNLKEGRRLLVERGLLRDGRLVMDREGW